jgi:hypothetical protein
MGRPPSCDCHCDSVPPLPDCFGCEVFSTAPSGRITDVMVKIGNSLTWDKPLFQECDIDLTYHLAKPLNCQKWGPGPCGTVTATGNTHVKFHSVSIGPFGGTQLLQRNPNGSCIWRKRRVKLLQEVSHEAATIMNPVSGIGMPSTILATYPSVHEERVTYPYVDPLDPMDQWSALVYPADRVSPAYYFPVFDERCYTPFGPWPVSGSGAVGNWRCSETAVSNVLELSIVKLALRTTYYGDILTYDPNGDAHWELKLRTSQAYAATTNITNSGVFGVSGFLSGSIKNYDGYRYSIPAITDIRDPAVDLDACPPYYKIAPGSYCGASSSGIDQLFSAYDPTILRWIKPVDCDADFLGDSLALTLDSPRVFLDSAGTPPCLNYHINAEKFGLNGYSTTAVVDLIYA